jgi:homoserine kinase
VRAAFPRDSVRVRVPATSANLGPGFDAVGLALALYDEVSAQATEGGLAIDVIGESAGDVAQDETHLVVQAMRATFDLLGVQPAGLALSCTNRIPHGRGLGSSAAAIVAGVLLAHGLTPGAELSPGDMIDLAAALEGHPDNVAACVLGGLTIAWTQASGSARAVRLEPVGVLPVVFIPDGQSSTKAARQALPQTVPHGDAAFNAARSALLIAALTSGTTGALWESTQDRLHQGYRAAGMPASIELMDRLRADGIAAVISGAGPAVMALCSSAVEVESIRSSACVGWRVQALDVDLAGARLLR